MNFQSLHYFIMLARWINTPKCALSALRDYFYIMHLYETQALLSDIVDIYGGFGVGLTFVW